VSAFLFNYNERPYAIPSWRNCNNNRNKVELELIPKLKGPLFMSKRPNGEARGGSIPAVVCDRRATKPVGLLLINPEGGIAFGGRRRWLVAYSPLRGCARRAALPAAKSDCRRGPFNLGISSNSTLLRFQSLFSLPAGVAVRRRLTLLVPPHKV
jgi:hypothetical protein